MTKTAHLKAHEEPPERRGVYHGMLYGCNNAISCVIRADPSNFKQFRCYL